MKRCKLCDADHERYTDVRHGRVTTFAKVGWRDFLLNSIILEGVQDDVGL